LILGKKLNWKKTGKREEWISLGEGKPRDRTPVILIGGGSKGGGETFFRSMFVILVVIVKKRTSFWYFLENQYDFYYFYLFLVLFRKPIKPFLFNVCDFSR
jgi:hypothetical protein